MSPERKTKGSSLQDLQRATVSLHSLRSEREILERLREACEETTSADRSFVYLVDPRWGELYGVRAAGEGEVRFGAGAGIAGWVAENREIWNCEDASRDPLYSAKVDSTGGGDPGTILGAPLAVEGHKPVGVLMLLDKVGGAFTDDDELFAALVCEHAASAIEAARDFRTAEKLSLDLASAVGAGVDAKSVVTIDHSARTARLAYELGKAMGLPPDDLRALEYAAHLHDIGRLELAGLPGAKPGEPGSLERLRTHVFFTDAVLRRISFPEPLSSVRDIAVSHHEAMDGSGFPRGLKCEEMSPAAKVLQVVNAFDVVAFQRRSLIEGDPVKVALVHLKKNRGKLYDEKTVDVFIDKKVYESERRRYPRYEYSTPVDVILLQSDGTESDIIETEALDISEGGILFSFDTEIQPASLLKLLIHLPSEKIEALAKAARSIPDGGKFKIGAYFVWHAEVR